MVAANGVVWWLTITLHLLIPFQEEAKMKKWYAEKKKSNLWLTLLSYSLALSAKGINEIANNRSLDIRIVEKILIDAAVDFSKTNFLNSVGAHPGDSLCTEQIGSYVKSKVLFPTQC